MEPEFKAVSRDCVSWQESLGHVWDMKVTSDGTSSEYNLAFCSSPIAVSLTKISASHVKSTNCVWAQNHEPEKNSDMALKMSDMESWKQVRDAAVCELSRKHSF